MYKRFLVLALAAIAATPTGAVAQKFWVVDVNNGPGTHFTNLVLAINAARDGDLIRLRKGDYVWPSELKKALTFQGEFGVRVVMSGSIFYPKNLRIHSIALGKTVSFRDLEISPASPVSPPMVHVDRVAGVVVFDAVQMRARHGIAVQANNSPHVVFRNCLVAGEVRGIGSRLLTEGGWFIGRPPVLYVIPGTTAITVTGGELSLGDTTVSVDGGSFRFPNPAVVANNARVMVRGKGSIITAGIGGVGTSAIVGDSSSRLFLDPSVTLTPSGGKSKASGFGQQTTKTLPMLRAIDKPFTGKKWSYTLTSSPDARYIVLFSLPGPGFSLPDQEAFLFTPSFLLLLHAGNVSATGTTTLTTQLGGDPRLSAWSFTLQGATADQSGWSMTNEMILSQR